MFQINLPSFDIKMNEQDGKRRIFDFLRRRYILLTPEEWVRQHFTHFLVEHKGYPAERLANEVTLSLNGMSRRCDSVLYNRDLSPKMIIEYKASNVKITQKVFEQIYRYNIVLRVNYLIVSNGLDHYCCKMDYENDSYEFLRDIPHYSEISAHEENAKSP
ncbi:MAG: type I restriction enzyme HsdR N-terminal domain-containing protein [Bacteroidaceae bacterium]